MPGIQTVNTLESTNNYVKEHIAELDNLSVVRAVEQTSGRGQGNHLWHSAPGMNLTFSVFMDFEASGIRLPAAELEHITGVITLSVRSYLGQKGIESRIKWPNDILVGDRKICGILIENSVSGGEIRNSIVGVGLNVNELQFPADIPNPTSVASVTGCNYELSAEMELLYKEIRRHFELLRSDDGRLYLKKEFDNNVFRLL